MSRTEALAVTVHTTAVVAGQPAFISVVDEYDDPVSNATVTLNGESVAETDELGWARFTVESVGEHTVEVSDGTVQSNERVVEAVSADAVQSPTASPEETETPESDVITTAETSLPTPGFGPLLGIAALLVGVGLARRR